MSLEFLIGSMKNLMRVKNIKITQENAAILLAGDGISGVLRQGLSSKMDQDGRPISTISKDGQDERMNLVMAVFAVAESNYAIADAIRELVVAVSGDPPKDTILQECLPRQFRLSERPR